MGPPAAAELLREALARGADAGALISDRRLAGSDTLATSIALAAAVRKVMPLELVLAGRQAIDGDTAQTGPQTAEKLGLPQVTYVERVEEVADGRLVLLRRLGRHTETLEAPLPLFLTVTAEAGEARPPRARRLLRYRRARTSFELRRELEAAGASGEELERRFAEESARLEGASLLLPTWGVEELGLDPAQVGLHGSPTKVKRCESVVLKSGEYRKVEPTEAGLRELLAALVHDHILG
jgi:electron transfer flavoprotein beta subunit